MPAPLVAGRGAGRRGRSDWPQPAAAPVVAEVEFDVDSVVVVGDSITEASAEAIRGQRSAAEEVETVDVHGQSRRRIEVGNGTRRASRCPASPRSYQLLRDGADPDVWVIALGTNDVGQYPDAEAYGELVDTVLGHDPGRRPARVGRRVPARRSGAHRDVQRGAPRPPRRSGPCRGRTVERVRVGTRTRRSCATTASTPTPPAARSSPPSSPPASTTPCDDWSPALSGSGAPAGLAEAVADATGPSGSGWRAPRRAWPAGGGCGRRPCARRRSTRSPTPATAASRG